MSWSVYWLGGILRKGLGDHAGKRSWDAENYDGHGRSGVARSPSPSQKMTKEL